MIFVTVGAQMPFDRLVRVVDQWAAERGRSDVFAQVGPAAWKPQNIDWVEFLSPAEFRQKVEQARVIVSHAGMGSILTGLELGRPILVLPRRGDLRETRNDHQLATARSLLAQGRISVAFDEAELSSKLDDLDSLSCKERVPSYASPELLEAIRHFVWQGTVDANRKRS
ncbi:MAG: glycosyltransferase [Terriglobales bacterium]